MFADEFDRATDSIKQLVRCEQQIGILIGKSQRGFFGWLFASADKDEERVKEQARADARAEIHHLQQERIPELLELIGNELRPILVWLRNHGLGDSINKIPSYRRVIHGATDEASLKAWLADLRELQAQIEFIQEAEMRARDEEKSFRAALQDIAYECGCEVAPWIQER